MTPTAYLSLTEPERQKVFWTALGVKGISHRCDCDAGCPDCWIEFPPLELGALLEVCRKGGFRVQLIFDSEEPFAYAEVGNSRYWETANDNDPSLACQIAILKHKGVVE